MPKTKKVTIEKVEEKKKSSRKKPVVKEEIEKLKPKPEPEKYYEAIGRRKTVIARVRLMAGGEKTFVINNKNLESYFPTHELQNIARSALEKMNCLDKFRILAKVKGGGFHSQAEAIRLGLARALVSFNPDFRKRLKRAGYLTRDPRMKERKKFGLKRARKAPQWQKR